MLLNACRYAILYLHQCRLCAVILKIGSVYRTIGKIIRSDLPILKLCDGLTSVTGGRKYMYVGYTERNHLNGEYSESLGKRSTSWKPTTLFIITSRINCCTRKCICRTWWIFCCRAWWSKTQLPTVLYVFKMAQTVPIFFKLFYIAGAWGTRSFPFTIGSPLQMRRKWTAKTHQHAHADTHQPAFFYIWPNDIDECRLVRFRHVASFWIKLMRFQSGCIVHPKCWIFGHMAFHR